MNQKNCMGMALIIPIVLAYAGYSPAAMASQPDIRSMLEAPSGIAVAKRDHKQPQKDRNRGQQDKGLQDPNKGDNKHRGDKNDQKAPSDKKPNRQNPNKGDNKHHGDKNVQKAPPDKKPNRQDPDKGDNKYHGDKNDQKAPPDKKPDRQDSNKGDNKHHGDKNVQKTPPDKKPNRQNPNKGDNKHHGDKNVQKAPPDKKPNRQNHDRNRRDWDRHDRPRNRVRFGRIKPRYDAWWRHRRHDIHIGVIWIDGFQERSDARHVLRRTAAVLERVQAFACRNTGLYWYVKNHSDQPGLGRAFSHQMLAKSYFHDGRYHMATFHSLLARAIALDFMEAMWDQADSYYDSNGLPLEEEIEIEEGDLDDLEINYWNNCPSDDELSVGLDKWYVSDVDALSIRINLDL